MKNNLLTSVRENRNQYQREWAKKNPDKIKAINHGAYEQNKETMLAKMKVYHSEHRDEIRTYQRTYHQKRLIEKRKEIYAYYKKWRDAHPEVIAQRNRARRVRSPMEIALVQKVYEDNIKKYGTLTCYLCLNPVEFRNDHLEHKTPISRGGKNEYDNLGVACARCNLKKHNKTEQEFRDVIQK